MIHWNEVTWYSRIAAIIVFVGIMPVVNFIIGVQYEQTSDALVQAETSQDPLSVTLIHKEKPAVATTTQTLPMHAPGVIPKPFL